MKKYFTHLAAALLVGAVAVSCSKDDGTSTEQPQFPTPIELAISSEEPVEITVCPNLEWTVSIPTSGEDAAWFRILDGEHEVYSIRGQANEEKTIRIAVFGPDEFDTDRVCTVSMTAGNQTRTIATLTRYRQNRSIQVYTAQLTTSDPYELYVTEESEEGSTYVYNEASTTSFHLVTPASEYNYQHRIRVHANMAWTINEFPEWLILSSNTGDTGSKELFLRTDAEKCPFEDAAEELRFIDSEAEGNPEIGRVTVKIPGCKDWCSSNLSATERFNAAGAYYIASQGNYGSPEYGTYKQFVAPAGSEIFLVVEQSDGNLAVGNAASWIRFKDEPTWSEQEHAAGLYEKRVQILCSANEGEARKAYLLAIPRGKVPTDFERSSVIDGKQIAAAYEEHLVSTIDQTAATSGDFVALYEDLGSEAAEYFSLTKIPAGQWPLEGSWASVPAAYNLTYKSEMAGEMAELKFGTPFTSYEIYGEDGPYANAEISPRWVDLADGWNDGGKLIQIACTYDKDTGKFNWTYERPQNPMAYFVFKNNDQIVGIIEFRFDESKPQGVALAGDYNPNIALTELSAGQSNYDNAYGSIPQYELICMNVGQLQMYMPDYDEFQGPEWLSIMPAGETKYLLADISDSSMGAVLFIQGGQPVFRIYCKFILDQTEE